VNGVDIDARAIDVDMAGWFLKLNREPFDIVHFCGGVGAMQIDH